MLSRVALRAAGSRRRSAGKKNKVITKRFVSGPLVNEAAVKQQKEVAELRDDMFATFDQFSKTAEVLAKYDKLLEAADRKKAAAAVAQAKNKAETAVSDLEVYEYQLAQREQFVANVDLTKTPLFSAKTSLERFQQRKKDIEALGNLPEEVKVLLAQEEQRLKELAVNEEIVEIEVDADVYNSVKNNLFPSFKNVSAEEYRDLLSGRGGPTDAAVAEEEAARAAGNEARANELAAANLGARVDLVNVSEAAAYSVSRKLGRPVAPGDVFPEKRLEFGAIQTSHPLLQADRKVYIPGEFKNLPNTLPLNRSELEKDPSKLSAAVDAVTAQLQTVEFTPTHFNPPDLARDLTVEQMDKWGLRKDVQAALLDFAQWEGVRANQPRNASELVIQLKLWKMWNYFFPYLDTKADRAAFMEQFDVSPGERTLEWTLSWPPPDHTFIEVPIYKESSDPAHATTADETVSWPRYRVWTDRLFEAELEAKSHHGHEEIAVTNIKAVPLTPSQQQLADQIKQLEAQLAPSH